MTDQKKTIVEIGKKVSYKFPLTLCYKDGHMAEVIGHGPTSNLGTVHRIKFKDGDIWDVLPDEITPIS